MEVHSLLGRTTKSRANSQTQADRDFVKERGQQIQALTQGAGFKFLDEWIGEQVRQAEASSRDCDPKFVPGFRAASRAYQSIFVQLAEWVSQGQITSEQENKWKAKQDHPHFEREADE